MPSVKVSARKVFNKFVINTHSASYIVNSLSINVNFLSVTIKSLQKYGNSFILKLYTAFPKGLRLI